MFTSKCLRTRYQNVRRGSSGRVQVFHDLTYAQAFTQVRTRVLSHIHTHSRSRINTQSAFAFLSPLGTGFLFSSQLSALSTPLSSVQKQPPSLESETTCFFSSLLLLIFFRSFLLLLILRVEQFVCLGVRRVLHGLDFLSDLVGRVEAGAAQFAVDAFGVAVPVVPGHADHVAGLQGNVLAIAGLVGVDGNLIVGVLTSEVVDVIQRVEEGGGVWMQCLHNLISHTADLKQKHSQVLFL